MSLIFRHLRRHWPLIAAGLVILLACSGMQLLMPLVIRGFFDDLQKLARGGQEAVGLYPASFARHGIKFVALGLLVALTRMSYRSILWPLSRRIESEIRREYFDHLRGLPPEYFYASTTGDLISRATSDIGTVQRFFAMGIICFGDALVMTPASLVIMAKMNWWLALLAAAPLLVGAPLSKLLMRQLHASYLAGQDSLGLLTARVQEDVTGVRTLKTYAREEAALANFDLANGDYTRKALRVAGLNSFFEPYFRLLPEGAILLVLVVGGGAVLTGTMTLGEFVAFLYYVNLMVWPTFAVGMGLNILQRARASAGRIQEVLDVPSAERPPEEAGPESFAGRMEFRSLTFSHCGRVERALDGISLDVPAGQILGITGPTGSGKSTLLALAGGLLSPPPGTVLVDGADIRGIGRGKLRRAVTLVEQTPFLFSRTLEENVAYGRISPPAELIRDAIHTAGLAPDVERFEGGLSTVIGERGVTLSGGQRLRSALARALVIEPRVLLLDDVFSAVDLETERSIWERIRKRLSGTTVVIVSHRVSVLRRCDRVAVLREGRLAELGTHEQLIDAGGFYAETFLLQERFGT